MDHYRYPEQHGMEAFRICGNVYFVGDEDVCAHLIDTGDGLIAIDTGYPTAQGLYINSIWSLGFKPQDVKIILHSHGHSDHFGCTRLLQSLSGAETYLGWKDAQMFHEQPELALCGDSVPFAYAQLFTPDHEVKDGDMIRLGNTEIRCVETPGHTEGTISYFFEIQEGGTRYKVGLLGGIGQNTMHDSFYERYHVSGYREQFAESLRLLHKEQVDITLGTHTGQAEFLQSREALLRGDGGNPFIDPTRWERFLRQNEEGLARLMENPY